MSIFEKGEKMLATAFDYAARKIDYCQVGGQKIEGIPAKLGKTVFRYSSPSGVTVRTEQRDFILPYKKLNFAPKTGDEIIFGEEIFLVCAPNNEPCWKWHTRNSHSEIRIHTKKADDY